jgi:DNA-binding transcriptional LysR family regulator
VSFTSFGQAFLRHAKLMVSVSQRATDEIAQMRGLWQGTINMAVSPAIGLGMLPKAIRQFSQQHPQVLVRCREGLYPGVGPLLRDGTLDFALTPVHRLALESDLVAEPLYGSQALIIGPRAHPLAGAATLEELRDCEWVLSSPSRGPGAVIEEAFEQAGLGAPRVRMVCESFLALPGVIASSQDWLATVPKAVFENCAVRSELAVIPVREELPTPIICTVRRHDMPLTPAAMQLVAWIQHYALKG